MEVLREKIAAIVQECVERNVIAARNRDRTTLTSTEAADRILALPEIAAGQKLLMLEVKLGEFDMSSAFKEPPGTREPE